MKCLEFTKQLIATKANPLFPAECQQYLVLQAGEMDATATRTGREALSTTEMLWCCDVAHFTSLLMYVGNQRCQDTITKFHNICCESIRLSEANGMDVEKAVDETFTKYRAGKE